jgi:hypothetical protein
VETSVQPLVRSEVEAALKGLLPLISSAVDERFKPVIDAVDDLPKIKAELDALKAPMGAKIKAALDSNGDWLQMLVDQNLKPNSVQRSAVEGGSDKGIQERKPESDFAHVWGEPESPESTSES